MSAASGSVAGETDRSRFEAWYTLHAFDLAANPIGSRECHLQWKAWEAAIEQSKMGDGRVPLGWKTVPIDPPIAIVRAALSYVAEEHVSSGEEDPPFLDITMKVCRELYIQMVQRCPGIESTMGRALFEFEEYVASVTPADVAVPEDRPAILNDAADLQLAVVELCHDFGLPLSEVMLKAVERKRSGEYKGKVDA